MQADYVREFFSEIKKILAELENDINRDNSTFVDRNINKILNITRSIKKKLKTDFKKITERREFKEWVKDDEL